LVIVPPTEERMRRRPIMAEKVAIDAVMAWCLPAYMAVGNTPSGLEFMCPIPGVRI
jgi:hypothetical protein